MDEKPEQLRLIGLDYADGARQLAVSEAIMGAVGQGLAPPTLRLYSWSEPVIILGVGQPVSDIDQDACRQRGYRVLRRIGGGTAVYHDAGEISIDLIVPAGHRLAPSDVHAGYRMFSDVLGRALEWIGIATTAIGVEQARDLTNDQLMRPLCFASISPYEFFTAGRKLNGLCQIRRREAIAYQTAIYNRFRPEPLLASLKHESMRTRDLRARRLKEFVTDMETARGRPADFEELQSALVEAVQERLGVEVNLGGLTDWEETETKRLISDKYGCDGWTFRR